MDVEHAQVPLQGRLSREIVRLHAGIYGRGPTNARCHLTDEYGLCVLEGVFTVAERTLIEAGSEEHVRGIRRTLQEVSREQYVEAVEELTGRRVRTFVSQIDVAGDLSVELFLFAEESDGG